jgi:hypothetical protein
MAHAKLCGRIQTLIETSHIRFALRRLDVTISVARLTDAGGGGMFTSQLLSDLHMKPFSSPTLDPVSSAKINRRESRDAGKLFT